MPILSRNLQVMHQIRVLGTRTRLERGQHTYKSVLKAGSWYKDGPAREDNLAAVQIHQQKQPNRTSSNRPVSLVDLGSFRPVTKRDQSHGPARPNRNTMAAARNASRGTAEWMDRRMGYRNHRHEDRDNQDEAYPEAQSRSPQQELKTERRGRGPEMIMDEEQELRTVREAVFGTPEESEEDERLRAQAEADLLARVAAQKVVEQQKPTLSRKVIQPYNSYRNHRTRWAEFRHGMIYGRSSF